MNLRSIFAATLISAVLPAAGFASADVQVIIDEDNWFASAGEVNSIFFTEFPEFTFITDQYEDLGVLFTEGDEGIISGDSYEDNAGLFSTANNDIVLEFATAQNVIGVQFPGLIRIDLYDGGDLFYTSPLMGGSGGGHFGGLISDLSFDKAVIYDPGGYTFIDDVHFGPPIPAPGVLPVLGMGLLLAGRRRRRRW